MNEYDPVEMVKSQMSIPEGNAQLSDFGLDGVDWFDFSPDDLVNLYLYKTQLFWENLMFRVTRGETIPSIVYFERMMKETGLNLDELETFLFAGSQIVYDRELREMSEEEREAHLSGGERLDDDIDDDPHGLGNVFQEAIDRQHERESFIIEFESLLSDSQKDLTGED